MAPGFRLGPGLWRRAIAGGAAGERQGKRSPPMRHRTQHGDPGGARACGSWGTARAGSTDLLGNSALRSETNARLALSLVGANAGGGVAFDEVHHGFGLARDHTLYDLLLEQAWGRTLVLADRGGAAVSDPARASLRAGGADLRRCGAVARRACNVAGGAVSGGRQASVRRRASGTAASARLPRRWDCRRARPMRRSTRGLGRLGATSGQRCVSWDGLSVHARTGRC